MKKLILTMIAVVVMSTAAIAAENEDSKTAAGAMPGIIIVSTAPVIQSITADTELTAGNVAIAAAMAPLHIPVSIAMTTPHLLSYPYFGMAEAYRGADKIKNDAGRIAVKIIAAPFLIPAAVLHLPNAALSLAFPEIYLGY
ncbi:hypothetical protein [Trichlorobacter lovleyi]|uniref:hypothetical protein n=1 Tax=Trichlorobacter lovleyi TaxID=313985 RepID=UPI002FDDDBC4